MNTSRLFKFPKTNGGHEIWVMGHFWKTLIFDSYIAQTNAICIYCESEFYDNFFVNKNFPNPPTQIFKYWFSLKCVGVIFFRPHIRIQNKILHQMICVDIGLSEIRLRKGGLIEIHLFTPTQSIWVYRRSLKIAARCSEGLKTILNIQIIVLVMVEKSLISFSSQIFWTTISFF